ncbi:MAG: hypothetical protein ACM33T_12140 [Solirubrobacterales bacterium]
MGVPYTLEQQAESFASAFPEEDRAFVRDWYLAKLQREAEARFWRLVEAAVTVLILVAVLPSLALWAYFTLS